MELSRSFYYELDPDSEDMMELAVHYSVETDCRGNITAAHFESAEHFDESLELDAFTASGQKEIQEAIDADAEENEDEISANSREADHEAWLGV